MNATGRGANFKQPSLCIFLYLCTVQKISNLLVPGQLAEASRVILVLNVHLPVLVRGFGDYLGNDVGVPVLAGNVLRQELDLEVGFSKNEPVSYDFMS